MHLLSRKLHSLQIVPTMRGALRCSVGGGSSGGDRSGGGDGSGGGEGEGGGSGGEGGGGDGDEGGAEVGGGEGWLATSHVTRTGGHTSSYPPQHPSWPSTTSLDSCIPATVLVSMPLPRLPSLMTALLGPSCTTVA